MLHHLKHYDFKNHGFYGSVTVGERGQIVIPHEARTQLNIKPSDKLVVFGHGPMIHLIKSNQIDAFLEKMTQKFTNIRASIKKEG